MLANYLVGLREGLEASLVVVVLVAHLVRTGRRGLLPAVWAGVAVAVSVSVAFGALLTFGPRGLTFEAQEMIGGTLSIVAVGFVTWMVLWMATAARSLSGELKGRLDAAAQVGRRALVVVAMLAVGREGLETALFLWAATRAAAAGGTRSTTAPLVGALLGILTAVVLGWLVYRGALRLNLSRFFAWTGGLLVVIAAGVLSYGVHDLQEASVLPGLNSLAFDVSHILTPTSVTATVLKGVFNLSPATTWLELTAWVGYVVAVMPLFVRRLRSAAQPRPAPAAAVPVATPVPGDR
jgi:high-affinity iron transporter